MNPETFLDSFGHIADAPGGVDKLRRLILDLAMRGRLARPDRDDEPVSELLARIDHERERRIAERSMRRPRVLGDPANVEVHHDIPAGWRWVKIARVAQVVGGGTPSAGDTSNFAVDGIPWITPADMDKGRTRHIRRGGRDLSDKGYASCSATLMPAGSLVMSSRAPIGYVAVAANDLCTNQGFKSLVPHVMECSPFLYWALRAYTPVIETLGSGTTFKEVSGGVMEGFPLPLPPIQEQSHLVERVDELMALCDELEEQQTARAEARSALTAATLHRVTDADAVDDLRAAIRAFADNIGIHFAPGDGDLAALKHLRQSILDLAARGRLTRQDPTDQPATELLDQIAADRDRLVKAKEIRMPRPVASIREEDCAFAAPSGWRWCRLGDLLVAPLANGRSVPTREGGFPVLRLTAMRGEVIDLGECKGGDWSEQQARPHLVANGDVFVSRGNGSIGLVGRASRVIADDSSEPVAFPDTMIRIQPPTEAVDSAFLTLLWNSPLVRRQIELKARTTAGIYKVSQDDLRSIALPVPPLAEQRRIVGRVGELMASCHELEQQLLAARAVREDLAASITAHAVPTVFA